MTSKKSCCIKITGFALATLLVVALSPAIIGAGFVAYAQDCGCMDVVFVVDDTGSMGSAIANVKAGLASIITAAQIASGGDLRMGLVSFKDNVEVDLVFTDSGVDATAITNAVNALVAGGGGGEPEASDEAIKYVATGATACTLVGSPPLGAFRDECLKIAILVTDARPAGCDSLYADGVDDVNAQNAANAAAAAGVLISAILVDNGSIPSAAHPTGVEPEVMAAYSATTGGVFITVPADGTGADGAITEIIEACGTAANECPRSQGFWKNHEDEWPVDSLEIGGTVYTKEQLLAVLNAPVRGNAVLILAKQLIAAELNIANGSNPAVIAAERAAAHALLTGVDITSNVVRTNTATGHSMTWTAGVLDTYNNRLLTPDCEDNGS